MWCIFSVHQLSIGELLSIFLLVRQEWPHCFQAALQIKSLTSTFSSNKKPQRYRTITVSTLYDYIFYTSVVWQNWSPRRWLYRLTWIWMRYLHTSASILFHEFGSNVFPWGVLKQCFFSLSQTFLQLIHIHMKINWKQYLNLSWASWYISHVGARCSLLAKSFCTRYYRGWHFFGQRPEAWNPWQATLSIQCSMAFILRRRPRLSSHRLAALHSNYFYDEFMVQPISFCHRCLPSIPTPWISNGRQVGESTIPWVLATSVQQSFRSRSEKRPWRFSTTLLFERLIFRPCLIDNSN